MIEKNRLIFNNKILAIKYTKTFDNKKEILKIFASLLNLPLLYL